MSENRYIYVMLACTTTSVSRLIKHVTKSKYTHAAIACDRELTEMYSFARRRPHNFLISGFIHEDLDTGVYSWNKNSPCVLYRFSVSEETYTKVRDILGNFLANYDRHTYNALGLVAINHNKVLPRKYKYACSQFVSHVLEEAGVTTLPKNKWLMQPDDLIDLPNAEVVFEGKIKDVRNIE